MEDKFSEQDSLRIINEMISQAKNNIQTDHGLSMIVAGYSTAFVAILDFILIHTLNNPLLANWIWLLMIPMYLVLFFLRKSKEKRAVVKTHIDKIIESVWVAFVISVICFLITVFGSIYLLNTWKPTILITPIMLILVGMAQFSVAAACRFKPFYYGAFVFWGGTIVSLLSILLLGRGDVQFIILAACMILGFCIPGHSLSNKVKKNV